MGTISCHSNQSSYPTGIKNTILPCIYEYFAKFDEIPLMTLQDIKETKRYGHTFVHTDGRTDNVKTKFLHVSKISFNK